MPQVVRPRVDGCCAPDHTPDDDVPSHRPQCAQPSFRKGWPAHSGDGRAPTTNRPPASRTRGAALRAPRQLAPDAPSLPPRTSRKRLCHRLHRQSRNAVAALPHIATRFSPPPPLWGCTPPSRRHCFAYQERAQHMTEGGQTMLTITVWWKYFIAASIMRQFPVVA